MLPGSSLKSSTGRGMIPAQPGRKFESSTGREISFIDLHVEAVTQDKTPRACARAARSTCKARRSPRRLPASMLLSLTERHVFRSTFFRADFSIAHETTLLFFLLTSTIRIRSEFDVIIKTARFYDGTGGEAQHVDLATKAIASPVLGISKTLGEDLTTPKSRGRARGFIQPWLSWSTESLIQ